MPNDGYLDTGPSPCRPEAKPVVKHGRFTGDKDDWKPSRIVPDNLKAEPLLSVPDKKVLFHSFQGKPGAIGQDTSKLEGKTFVELRQFTTHPKENVKTREQQNWKDSPTSTWIKPEGAKLWEGNKETVVTSQTTSKAKEVSFVVNQEQHGERWGKGSKADRWAAQQRGRDVKVTIPKNQIKAAMRIASRLRDNEPSRMNNGSIVKRRGCAVYVDTLCVGVLKGKK